MTPPGPRSTQVGFQLPELDEAGTTSTQADLSAAAVLAAIGEVPVNLAVFTVPEGTGTMPDRHESQELWLVRSGRGRIRVEGREFPAGPGQLFALTGGEEHEFLADHGDAEVLSLWWKG